MNKLKTPLLASLCMLLFSVASHAETQWLDRIVAIVDDNVILLIGTERKWSVRSIQVLSV